jgi:hypothetical protein
MKFYQKFAQLQFHRYNIICIEQASNERGSSIMPAKSSVPRPFTPGFVVQKKKKKERKKNEKEHMPQMISSRQNSPAEGRAALVPLLQFTIPR